MPHARDEIHGQELAGAGDAEARLDQALVHQGLARRDDGIMRAVTDDDGVLQVPGIVEPAQVVRDRGRAQVRIPCLDLVEREDAVAVRVVEPVELRDRGRRVPEDRGVRAERPFRRGRRPPVLGSRYTPDVEGQAAHMRRHVVDVEQRLELVRSERGTERSGRRIPVRPVVDARCDDVEVADEPRVRAHPLDVRGDAVPREAAVVFLRVVLHHHLGVVAAVRATHHERAPRWLPVVAADQGLRVLRELQDPAPRLVVLVLGLIDDGEAVPALIAEGVRVALLQSHRLEGARGVLVARESARAHGELSVPIVRQGDLEFRVAEDAVDVAVGHRRRAALVDIDVGLRPRARGERRDRYRDEVRSDESDNGDPEPMTGHAILPA